VKANEYDVLVIGGGIHGAGVAQAAAATGRAALLLEARGPAAGTSSRSSKLIHGGLRYLESFELGLVSESLAEREVLLQTAPHLVRLVDFYLPVYKQTSRRPLELRAGLSLYALLGRLRPSTRFERLKKSAWGDLDGLKTEDLQAVFRYSDGQTDDARLVRSVLSSAASLGCELCYPAEVLSATREERGWLVRFRAGEEEREVRAATLVNAAGPWVEHVRHRISPTPDGRAVDLVGGTHLELAGRLKRGIYYTEAPRDRRAVFTMPWKDHILLGTTERTHLGDPADVAPTQEEEEYLLETYSHHFPGTPEVLNSWAGLRVLPRAAGDSFHRSRETLLFHDDPQIPRYVGIYGGKLTGYRATADRVLNTLRAALPVRPHKADTRTLRLPDVD
jgi:glycerol-3-phosphate dehydrogenase